MTLKHIQTVYVMARLLTHTGEDAILSNSALCSPMHEVQPEAMAEQPASLLQKVATFLK